MSGPALKTEAKVLAGISHGGKRKGAGRKAADGATGLVQLAPPRVTEAQREKYKRLGSGVWLRAAIEAAPEPADDKKGEHSV